MTIWDRWRWVNCSWSIYWQGPLEIDVDEWIALDPLIDILRSVWQSFTWCEIAGMLYSAAGLMSLMYGLSFWRSHDRVWCNARYLRYRMMYVRYERVDSCHTRDWWEVEMMVTWWPQTTSQRDVWSRRCFDERHVPNWSELTQPIGGVVVSQYKLHTSDRSRSRSSRTWPAFTCCAGSV